jgi:hypothetical protein
MSKRKKNLVRRGTPTAVRRRPLVDEFKLDEIDLLMESQQWEEAYADLLQIEKQAPNDEHVLSRLQLVSAEFEHWPTYERVARKRFRLKPNAHIPQ